MNKPKKELTFEEKVLKELKEIRKELKEIRQEVHGLQGDDALVNSYMLDFIMNYVGGCVLRDNEVINRALYYAWCIKVMLNTDKIFPRQYYPTDEEIKKYGLGRDQAIYENEEKFLKFMEDRKKEEEEKYGNKTKTTL